MRRHPRTTCQAQEAADWHGPGLQIREAGWVFGAGLTELTAIRRGPHDGGCRHRRCSGCRLDQYPSALDRPTARRSAERPTGRPGLANPGQGSRFQRSRSDIDQHGDRSQPATRLPNSRPPTLNSHKADEYKSRITATGPRSRTWGHLSMSLPMEALVRGLRFWST